MLFLALLLVLPLSVPASQWACTHTTTCVPGAKGLCTPVCAPGTVTVSAAYAAARDAHWARVSHMPFALAPALATHNSALAYAEGYGLWDAAAGHVLHTTVVTANQRLSLFDQVAALGVTHLEIDVHYHDGELRICHAGGVYAAWLDRLLRLLSHVLHVPIDWDTETLGCFGTPAGDAGPKEIRFAEALTRVAAGLAARADAFLVLFLDLNPDLARWGKVPDLVSQAQAAFGGSLLTPSDTHGLGLNANTTYAGLVAAGKRVLFVSRVDFGGVGNASSVFFTHGGSPLWPAGWREGSPDSTLAWHAHTGMVSRVVPDACVYGPFFNGPRSKGTTNVTRSGGVQGLTFACADMATPDDFWPFLSRWT